MAVLELGIRDAGRRESQSAYTLIEGAGSRQCDDGQVVVEDVRDLVVGVLIKKQNLTKTIHIIHFYNNIVV